MSRGAPEADTPGLMVPPYTMREGRFRRPMAMSVPGMFLSQPGRLMLASYHCALITCALSPRPNPGVLNVCSNNIAGVGMEWGRDEIDRQRSTWGSGGSEISEVVPSGKRRPVVVWSWEGAKLSLRTSKSQQHQIHIEHGCGMDKYNPFPIRMLWVHSRHGPPPSESQKRARRSPMVRVDCSKLTL